MKTVSMFHVDAAQKCMQDKIEAGTSVVGICTQQANLLWSMWQPTWQVEIFKRMSNDSYYRIKCKLGFIPKGKVIWGELFKPVVNNLYTEVGK